jgi:hypothetical protein
VAAARRLKRAAVTLALVLLAGCGATTATTATPPPGTEALPSWVVSLNPHPGSSSEANTVVEVEHTVTEPDHEVRLIVDGVDVTAGALIGARSLAYEPLSRGSHTVRIEHVWLPGAGADLETIETFTWRFETL